MEETKPQTQTYALPQIEAEKMPNVIYVGFVDDIAQPTQRDGSNYENMRISLKGTNGSKDYKANFTFRSDWFDPAFKIRDFKDATDEKGNPVGKSLTFVYHSNLVATATSRKVTTLAALAGSPENYSALWSELLNARVAKGSDLDGNEVHACIRHFVREVAQQPKIGYVLTQQTEKSEDGGKPILTEQYQVGSFFFLDSDGNVPAWIDSQVKQKKAIYGFER